MGALNAGGLRGGLELDEGVGESPIKMHSSGRAGTVDNEPDNASVWGALMTQKSCDDHDLSFMWAAGISPSLSLSPCHH